MRGIYIGASEAVQSTDAVPHNKHTVISISYLNKQFATRSSPGEVDLRLGDSLS